jgi:uncharacterized membrane protein YphA (DoxX/SURF4 family)
MRIVRVISRILVGIIFIFSGFVKGQDPMGFMFKLEDYFIAYGWDWAMPFALTLAVILCTIEFSIGTALLLNLWPRLAGWGLLAIMTAFLILTFLSALNNPVPDCGCFGDAIHLTNWQTFFKNLFLMIPTLAILRTIKMSKPLFSSRAQSIVLCVIFLLFGSFTVYSYNRLPYFDFMDWKEGRDVTPAGAGQAVTYLIYTNTATGETTELLSKDLPWQDSVWMSQWEFSTIRVDDSMVRKGHDLLIYDSTGTDVTTGFIDHSSFQFLLISYDLNTANIKALEEMSAFYQEAAQEGYSFVLLTGTLLTEATGLIRRLELPYEIYNADDITLKTMIRSNPGLILMKDGLIMEKWQYHCFPDFKAAREEYLLNGGLIPHPDAPE